MHNHDLNKKLFFEQGWCRFGFDLGIKQWVNASLPFARKTVVNESYAKWLRCGGTWFVGVNALPNGADSSLPGGPSLKGEAYHAVRNQVFNQCRRIELSAKPGEAYLMHRLTLHGISPWLDGAEAFRDGRMICYFRPEIGCAWEWLNKP